jgi:hypothetical protein
VKTKRNIIGKVRRSCNRDRDCSKDTFKGIGASDTIYHGSFETRVGSYDHVTSYIPVGPGCNGTGCWCGEVRCSGGEADPSSCSPPETVVLSPGRRPDDIWGTFLARLRSVLSKAFSSNIIPQFGCRILFQEVPAVFGTLYNHPGNFPCGFLGTQHTVPC